MRLTSSFLLNLPWFMHLLYHCQAWVDTLPGVLEFFAILNFQTWYLETFHFSFQPPLILNPWMLLFFLCYASNPGGADRNYFTSTAHGVPRTSKALSNLKWSTCRFIKIPQNLPLVTLVLQLPSGSRYNWGRENNWYQKQKKGFSTIPIALIALFSSVGICPSPDHSLSWPSIQV